VIRFSLAPYQAFADGSREARRGMKTGGHTFTTPKVPFSVDIVVTPNPVVFGNPFLVETGLSRDGLSEPRDHFAGPESRWLLSSKLQDEEWGGGLELYARLSNTAGVNC
jgi:hypothetical protein